MSVFTPGSDEVIVNMNVSVDLLKKVAGGPGISLDAAEMAEAFKKAYDNQVMTVGQQLAFDYNGQKFDLIVEGVDYPALESARKTRFERGQVKSTLNIEFVKRRDSQTPILFTSGKAGANTNTNLFKKEFNFEQVGIGGLGAEFEKIFRRAFASRIFPGLIKEIGMNHVRGILLYGPPGKIWVIMLVCVVYLP
jgi:vesicle-fusing ATPase